MYREIVFVAVALLVGFTSGWKVQGWRKDKEIADLQNTTAQNYAAVQAQARAKEQDLAVKADLLRKDKDVQITNIRKQLDNSLIELRKRKERPAVIREVPGTALVNANTEWCTGARLFRDDATAFTREAALAAELQKELQLCREQYENVRQSLLKN